jgi:hypothetical protein
MSTPPYGFHVQPATGAWERYHGPERHCEHCAKRTATNGGRRAAGAAAHDTVRLPTSRGRRYGYKVAQPPPTYATGAASADLGLPHPPRIHWFRLARPHEDADWTDDELAGGVTDPSWWPAIWVNTEQSLLDATTAAIHECRHSASIQRGETQRETKAAGEAAADRYVDTFLAERGAWAGALATAEQKWGPRR